MARIKEIQHVNNKKTYAEVFVLLEDGTEARVMVGGSVEVYLDHGIIKAFVKKVP